MGHLWPKFVKRRLRFTSSVAEFTLDLDDWLQAEREKSFREAQQEQRRGRKKK